MQPWPIREQSLVVEGLSAIAEQLPFALRGLIPIKNNSRSATTVARFIELRQLADWIRDKTGVPRGVCDRVAHDYRPPNGRRKMVARHQWRTRPDAFSASWPLVESWLLAEPNVTAKKLMRRLTRQLSDFYSTCAQLRSLQRWVKAWRAQWVRQLVFAASSATQTDLESRSML